jgi:hypothetical protein
MDQAAASDGKKDQVVGACANCSSIQLGPDEWQSLEAFLRERFGLTVKRGVCPGCLERFYPELAKRSERDA